MTRGLLGILAATFAVALALTPLWVITALIYKAEGRLP